MSHPYRVGLPLLFVSFALFMLNADKFVASQNESLEGRLADFRAEYQDARRGRTLDLHRYQGGVYRTLAWAEGKNIARSVTYEHDAAGWIVNAHSSISFGDDGNFYYVALSCAPLPGRLTVLAGK